MRTPRNLGAARGRNQSKTKPNTGFTFNWNAQQKPPAVPPSNLQSLTDGSNISFVSPNQHLNTEDAGESLSESKNSQSSRSSCTPNQQGDDIIRFINQKTAQPEQIDTLTSIKMSQANHALQLHRVREEKFSKIRASFFLCYVGTIIFIKLYPLFTITSHTVLSGLRLNTSATSLSLGIWFFAHRRLCRGFLRKGHQVQAALQPTQGNNLEQKNVSHQRNH